MIQFFSTYDNVFYTIAAICFILGLKKLSHPKTARKGNFIAILGMFIAIVVAIFVGTTKHDIELSFIITGIMIGAAIGTSPHRSIGTVFLAPLFVFLAQWAYGQGVNKAWREIARTGGKAGEGAQIDDRIRTA